MKIQALFFLPLALLSAASCRADVPTLKERQNPFYIGGSCKLQSVNRGNTDFFTTSLISQGQYGWDTGTSVQAIVPAILEQQGSDKTGNPRIGGGPNNRIEVDGLFRAYGDTDDYLGFELGVGFPFQTTQQQQNSVNASWMIPASILGRIDWDWIALEPSLSDSPSFPATRSISTGELAEDVTNSVTAAATVYFYPFRWLAPYVNYTENFPSAITVASETTGTSRYYIRDIVNTGRTRTIALGTIFAPVYVPVTFATQFEYTPVTPLSTDTVYAGTASIRWLF